MVGYVVLCAIIAAQLIVSAYERGKMLRELHRLAELAAAKDLSEFRANEERGAKKERIDLFSERAKKRKGVKTGPFGGV